MTGMYNKKVANLYNKDHKPSHPHYLMSNHVAEIGRRADRPFRIVADYIEEIEAWVWWTARKDRGDNFYHDNTMSWGTEETLDELIDLVIDMGYDEDRARAICFVDESTGDVIPNCDVQAYLQARVKQDCVQI